MRGTLREALRWAAPFALAATGCKPTDPALELSVDFASPELRERAELVQVTYLQGGCNGVPVFSTEVTPDQEGESPGKLGPGHYGFSARALDAACLWFATGCSEATLPSSASLTVVLNEASHPQLEPSCSPHGAMDAGVDASTPQPDGGDGDGDGDGDAGDGDGDGDGDAGGGFDETAPKCSELPADLVACYDFDGDLLDATSHHNDATVLVESPELFENTLSGKGIRAAGQPVKVDDDPSLNFATAFTIEIWFRADALDNLDPDDAATAVSLLFDKDQQYDLGFDPNGDVVGEVYEAVSTATDFTATDSDVVTGAFTYVAFVYDGTNGLLYQDGSLRVSQSLGLTPFGGNGGVLHFGSGAPNATRGFDGLIDAVRMWKRVLEPGEICASAGREPVGDSCL
jgi:hypothetical protein